MRKLFSIILFLAGSLVPAVAYSHGEYLKHQANYTRQVASGQLDAAAQSASLAAINCSKVQNYTNAFKVINTFDRYLEGMKILPDSMPGAYYLIARTRYEIYNDMGHTEKAGNQLPDMLANAGKSGKKQFAIEALGLAAQHYFTTKQMAKGDECITKLIGLSNEGNDLASTDSAFQAVIKRGVEVNSAGMVKRTYDRYIQWADSVEAANADTELAKARREIDDLNQVISDKDSTITVRNATIGLLAVLLGAAAIVVVACLILYLRMLRRNKRLAQSVKAANDQSALKSEILHNLGATMAPTLGKLDSRDPAIKNLLDFVNSVSELSDVGDTAPRDPEALDDVSLQPFCEAIADKVRPLLRQGVKLSVDVPRVSAKIDPSEVEKILEYLLTKAAKNTPEDGKIFFSYKKRGVHVHQFVVSDNGPAIAPEERENMFTAFAAASEAADGDSLGLPICALRAEKLGGSLELDTDHSRGVTFVLTLR